MCCGTHTLSFFKLVQRTLSKKETLFAVWLLHNYLPFSPKISNNGNLSLQLEKGLLLCLPNRGVAQVRFMELSNR